MIELCLVRMTNNSLDIGCRKGIHSRDYVYGVDDRNKVVPIRCRRSRCTARFQVHRAGFHSMSYRRLLPRAVYLNRSPGHCCRRTSERSSYNHHAAGLMTSHYMLVLSYTSLRLLGPLVPQLAGVHSPPTETC